ncbi:hypothetical protein [Paraburkholderia sp. J41]|uniref:hypothetical protein n=1 Tax=Paraburkholderia sp. J41 TaxID=2805433 RepID=UPI002AC36940|nr:hypothetical protein [Paraburkholderia sp. J41]
MLYQVQGDAAALAHTKASAFPDEHFQREWAGLNAAGQAVVAMLARGETDMHGAAGLKRLSELTGKSATKNTAAQALRRLHQKNLVTRLAMGDYRIEDEAFAEWVRRRP